MSGDNRELITRGSNIDICYMFALSFRIKIMILSIKVVH